MFEADIIADVIAGERQNSARAANVADGYKQVQNAAPLAGTLGIGQYAALGSTRSPQQRRPDRRFPGSSRTALQVLAGRSVRGPCQHARGDAQHPVRTGPRRPADRHLAGPSLFFYRRRSLRLPAAARSVSLRRSSISRPISPTHGGWIDVTNVFTATPWALSISHRAGRRGSRCARAPVLDLSGAPRRRYQCLRS